MNDGEKFIKHCIENEVMHVFLIANPVNAIISRMLIEQYQISNILVISIRESLTDIVSDKNLNLPITILDRFFMKFFKICRYGRKLKKNIINFSKSYVVYTSWMYPEAVEVSSDKSCKGVVYIEEGQLSYYESNPYPKELNVWFNRVDEISKGNIDLYFSKAYEACVGLTEDSFPCLRPDKRIVIDDIRQLSKLYKPKLMDIKYIGLTPAPRRIPKEFIPALVKRLTEKIPSGGAIKFHPGFNIHKDLKIQIINELKNMENCNIVFCPDNTILELEMILDKKVLIGARSSLSIYAVKLGSKYIEISFDGYIEPVN